MVDTLYAKTEHDLVHLISSMGRDEQVWSSWKALFISLKGLGDDDAQDCLIWIKSIVASYLKHEDGQLYFCENHGVHILCKGTYIKVLQEAGAHICSLISDESNIDLMYRVYNLEHEADIYTHDVRNTVKNILSLSSTINNTKRTLSLSHAQGTQSFCNPLADKPKVLLIEDDPVTRWMVRHSLKNECDFMTAAYANKVFALYRTYEPDIVFLDIDLPDCSGHRVLKWIMNNDPGAYVVMFSSNNTLDNITTALDNGAQGFIAKPFLKADLLAHVHEYSNYTTTSQH